MTLWIRFELEFFVVVVEKHLIKGHMLTLVGLKKKLLQLLCSMHHKIDVEVTEKCNFWRVILGPGKFGCNAGTVILKGNFGRKSNFKRETGN